MTPWDDDDAESDEDYLDGEIECAVCEEEPDTLYRYGSEWLCEECWEAVP